MKFLQVTTYPQTISTVSNGKSLFYVIGNMELNTLICMFSDKVILTMRVLILYVSVMIPHIQYICWYLEIDCNTYTTREREKGSVATVPSQQLAALTSMFFPYLVIICFVLGIRFSFHCLIMKSLRS